MPELLRKWGSDSGCLEFEGVAVTKLCVGRQAGDTQLCHVKVFVTLPVDNKLSPNPVPDQTGHETDSIREVRATQGRAKCSPP